jgi:hypothetical protein
MPGVAPSHAAWLPVGQYFASGITRAKQSISTAVAISAAVPSRLVLAFGGPSHHFAEERIGGIAAAIELFRRQIGCGAPRSPRAVTMTGPLCGFVSLDVHQLHYRA